MAAAPFSFQSNVKKRKLKVKGKHGSRAVDCPSGAVRMRFQQEEKPNKTTRHWSSILTVRNVVCWVSIFRLNAQIL